MNELSVKLNFLLPSLPRAEKAVAQYMLDNFEQISDMTLVTLASETGTSEATVIRLCKNLGYSSFVQLRQAFAMASYTENSVFEAESVKHSDSMAVIFDKVTQNLVQSLSNTRVLLSDNYDKALEAIINARSVLFCSIGDSQPLCELACIKFRRLGINCFAPKDVMLQYESAMRCGHEDVLIALSNSGRSGNVIKTAKLAKQHGATTICITQTGRSPLLKFTDISLFTSSVDLTIGRDSMCKRIVALVIIESLYLGIIAHGTQDYKTLLGNTMATFEINSNTPNS